MHSSATPGSSPVGSLFFSELRILLPRPRSHPLAKRSGRDVAVPRAPLRRLQTRAARHFMYQAEMAGVFSVSCASIRTPCVTRCASPIRCPVNSRNRRGGSVETVRAKGGGFHDRSEHGAVPALDHLQGPLTGRRSAMPQCSRHRVQSVLRMDRGRVAPTGPRCVCVTTQRMPNV